MAANRHYVSQYNDWQTKDLLSGSSTSRTSRIDYMVTTATASRPTTITKTKPDSSGYRVPTPWSGTYSTFQPWIGSLRCRSWAGNVNLYEIHTLWGNLGTFQQAPQVDTSYSWPTSAMLHRAEVEALIKIKQAKVNYLVFSAEAKKSMSMIERSLIQLTTAYKNARRFRWGAACRSLGISRPSFRSSSKDVSGRWLELQYGWLPFLGDIEGAYNDMRVTGVFPRLSVSHLVKCKHPNPPPIDTAYWRGHYQTEGIYGVYVRLDYQPVNAALNLASQLGLTNPGLLMWEVLPFSFVLDWIAPLGNWLDAMDADHGLSFKGGSYTMFCRKKRRGFLSGKPAIGYKNELQHAYFECSDDRMVFVRSTYASSPIPVPYLEPDISGKRLYNALALFRNVIIR